MLKLRNLITISASIFLCLSLFGIIGGNSFLTILGRSFLGTLILSLLIVGAFYIINKIISQIPASDIGEVQSEQSIDSGTPSLGIDIVLDEKVDPYGAEDPDGLISGNENSNKSKGSSPVGDLVEEVEEDALGDINALDIKTNDNEVIEVMSDNGDDSLSPLDSASDLFGNTETVTSSASRRENEALNSLGDNANPQIIAKAIKTVLTRDENKG